MRRLAIIAVIAVLGASVFAAGAAYAAGPSDAPLPPNKPDSTELVNKQNVPGDVTKGFVKNAGAVPTARPDQPPFDQDDVTDPAQRSAAIYHWTPAIADYSDPIQELSYQISDLDDLKEQMQECELSREERRDYESRLRALAKYEGRTCTLEMAFTVENRMYVFDVQPDWYDEFIELEDEILAHLAEEDGLDDDTLGGYYSKN